MWACVTHRLQHAASAQRVTQVQTGELPGQAAGAAIMKKDGHLLVLVATSAVADLCPRHAADMRRSLGSHPQDALGQVAGDRHTA